MIRKILLLGCFFLLAFSAHAARPLEIADLFRIQRISSPSVSPDGRWVVFTVTTPDVEANKNNTDLWLASLDGSSVRALTSNPAQDRNSVWSPDGKWIAATPGT